ncbi:MAG: hypothetical protein M1816_001267 [Peltula sp. TS41687]|nr:MAG: hypothetical protein M1816_001267 [Peltula sp. TS41687]
MYFIFNSLLIGLLATLVPANPLQKTHGMTKALQQRSDTEPPPFNPDPDVSYTGPERPEATTSQSEYWRCIVKFMYNQVLHRYRYGRDITMERLAFVETEEHCYEKALQKWGVAPRRVPEYVIEWQIEHLDTYREEILKREERRARGKPGDGRDSTMPDKKGLKAKVMDKLRAARDRLRGFFGRMGSVSSQDKGRVPGNSWSPAAPGNLGVTEADGESKVFFSIESQPFEEQGMILASLPEHTQRRYIHWCYYERDEELARPEKVLVKIRGTKYDDLESTGDLGKYFDLFREFAVSGRAAIPLGPFNLLPLARMMVLLDVEAQEKQPRAPDTYFRVGVCPLDDGRHKRMEDVSHAFRAVFLR